MRARALSTAAVAASLTLVAGLTLTSAEASSFRELKACWKAPTGNTLPLTVTVSGRQFGQRTLANGTCKAWDVPTGNYTLTANAAAIRTTFNASPQGRATVCGKSSFHHFRVYAVVTRLGTTRTVTLGDSGGSVGVHVRKNHLTKVNFRLHCTS
jgi:Flp pilus assembly protein TadG